MEKLEEQYVSPGLETPWDFPRGEKVYEWWEKTGVLPEHSAPNACSYFTLHEGLSIHPVYVHAASHLLGQKCLQTPRASYMRDNIIKTFISATETRGQSC